MTRDWRLAPRAALHCAAHAPGPGEMRPRRSPGMPSPRALARAGLVPARATWNGRATGAGHAAHRSRPGQTTPTAERTPTRPQPGHSARPTAEWTPSRDRAEPKKSGPRMGHIKIPPIGGCCARTGPPQAHVLARSGRGAWLCRRRTRRAAPGRGSLKCRRRKRRRGGCRGCLGGSSRRA